MVPVFELSTQIALLTPTIFSSQEFAFHLLYSHAVGFVSVI